MPTPEDAAAFVADAERRLHDAGVTLNRMAWIQATYIIPDTEALLAELSAPVLTMATEIARRAFTFDDVETDPETRRKLDVLKRSMTSPAPADPARTAELTAVMTRMDSFYSKALCRPSAGEALPLEKVQEEMSTSRDAARLRDLWRGWYDASPPARDDYARFVELSNEGARSLGHADTGAMWRSKYDMDAGAFPAELERLWKQLEPFYTSLHRYVRTKLVERYGAAEVGDDGLIPMHLLGNIWGQEWGAVHDLVAPEAPADTAPYDLAARMKEKGIDVPEMVRIGERFFTSLGFDPLPPTFWDRSMFVRPRDREVDGYASAWDMDGQADFRLKMCLRGTDEDFRTVHHELGHIFYYQAYASQPYLFHSGANDGFHEAIGDTIALSLTPKYLVGLGLMDAEPDAAEDIPLLLRRALDGIAFLPFGYLVDRWRWEVFAGKITPDRYTEAWWELVARYQGIRPPVDRTGAPFDPGAKFHIPGNTPYTRYFLARVLQFQFHRALCKEAGETGPLHRASIHGSVAAGDKLRATLAMGQSRPWQDALEVLTGSREMDATAIIDYFAPLKTWLDEQNGEG